MQPAHPAHADDVAIGTANHRANCFRWPFIWSDFLPTTRSSARQLQPYVGPRASTDPPPPRISSSSLTLSLAPSVAENAPLPGRSYTLRPCPVAGGAACEEDGAVLVPGVSRANPVRDSKHIDTVKTEEARNPATDTCHMWVALQHVCHM